MKSLDKSAGQTLEDFKKVMEELRPYLPPPTRIIEPKSEDWRQNNPRTSRYRYDY